MILKTKHVNNTEQMIRRGKIKNLQGAKGAKFQGGKRGKITGGQRDKKCTGGHCPFCPIANARPWCHDDSSSKLEKK